MIYKAHGIIDTQKFVFSGLDAFSVKTGKLYAHLYLLHEGDLGEEQYAPVKDLYILAEDNPKIAEFLATSLVDKSPTRLIFHTPKRLKPGEEQLSVVFTNLFDGANLFELSARFGYCLTSGDAPIKAAWKQWDSDWKQLKKMKLTDYESGIDFTLKFMELLEKMCITLPTLVADENIPISPELAKVLNTQYSYAEHILEDLRAVFPYMLVPSISKVAAFN